MERITFTMRVKPGQQTEYCWRHRAVWPEMLQALKDAGCSNCSIVAGIIERGVLPETSFHEVLPEEVHLG